MMVTGLNDSQLKGKTEIAYWSKLKELFELTCPNNHRTTIKKIKKPKRVGWAVECSVASCLFSNLASGCNQSNFINFVLEK